ncbi:hypothetical protein [Halobacillus naozhouensis]|uniref:Uncharacterized protein n=1 Tax=Halobacillus naozhouensis TaxID=554880 RepID=A0ABY8J2C4_9BACI|nr:hypothetical protein [Halobacillus naozhouensis]WFT75548.1 hypothetical protein P9989_03905 [Halobacillus naozhouensis]
MSDYQSGELIQKRCRQCFHDEAKILKVDRKDFHDKKAAFIWCQCPECGMNDGELIPEGYQQESDILQKK